MKKICAGECGACHRNDQSARQKMRRRKLERQRGFVKSVSIAILLTGHCYSSLHRLIAFDRDQIAARKFDQVFSVFSTWFFLLTGRCINDLFSYAQKLWITLCINVLNRCRDPCIFATFRYPPKKRTTINHIKNNSIP